MMRWFKRLLLLLVIAAGVAGWFVYQDYQRFAEAPLAIGRTERIIDVPLGTPFNRIVSQLRSRGLTRAPTLYWRALAWEMRVAEGLHAGEYELSYGLTPRTLLDRMARGLVVQHRFTIVEGWTFRDLRVELARGEALTHDTAAMSDDVIMTRIGAPGVPPEGRFLPETYAYTRGFSELALLKRAYLAMDEALERAWRDREADTPLRDKDQLLVLASIVEKETGRAAERPRIAGVFIRRLRIGMKLQTDPTVIYGLGEAYEGNITRKHLQTDTPYNTYTRYGLPPGPIALPGKAAIRAAARPEPGKALYFVARGDGSHEFTDSLADHNRAVQKFQLRR